MTQQSSGSASRRFSSTTTSHETSSVPPVWRFAGTCLPISPISTSYENLSATFYTLASADGLIRHWRCDVDWITPSKRIYSIAGPCDTAMLAELRASSLFTVVEASIWHDWEWIDAPLSISTDTTLWFRCTA